MATASKETYLSSALTFASRNHGFADYGLQRMEELRSAPNGRENPFVVGTSTAQRFMKIVETMLRGRIAQDQQASTSARKGRLLLKFATTRRSPRRAQR
ncbi:hypothetical protein ACFYSF_45335 [Streptomyces canus]|uniref:hypothetical protein n=1 Tax=Streptomyces canus TaxID=58343 RepID=UPI0036B737E3